MLLTFGSTRAAGESSGSSVAGGDLETAGKVAERMADSGFISTESWDPTMEGGLGRISQGHEDAAGLNGSVESVLIDLVALVRGGSEETSVDGEEGGMVG